MAAPRAVALVFLGGLLAAPGRGSTIVAKDWYEQRSARVPMRDGVHLNTEIYVPRGGAGPWPILLTRTPYGLGHDGDGFHASLSSAYAELARDGYVFVFQDIRGRYQSEGSFVLMRPPRAAGETGAIAQGNIDEGTDTWDTIDWLLAHVREHNGRAGMLGISYGGWLTVMALLEPHPALRAVSPQASPSDLYLGDDFLHNGALRLSPAFGYVALMETGTENSPFRFDQRDVYEWYLELGPLANADRRYFHGEKPTWNAIMASPDYDAYWQRLAVLPYLRRATVPALHVAGWFDAEDFYGPLTIYRRLEGFDQRRHNFLVVGPWRHGGWARDDGDTFGDIPFGSATGRYYREQVERSFFAHYLKDAGAKDTGEAQPWPEAEALVFETGANLWRRVERWPPPGTERHLYLAARGRVAFEPPEETPGEPGDAVADTYVSDPAKPVPYMPRPIGDFWQGSGALWKVADQRFVDGRPDVLTYQSEPLRERFTIAGPIVAQLYASTTGSDADWVVKLIDVYPEDHPVEGLRGFQLMVADEVFRARYRRSFERGEAVPTGAVLDYRFELGDRYHSFLPGHRVMVQVQSTWFPLIDRNPQTFVLPRAATEADFRPATHRIHRSAAQPSHLVVRVPAGR